MRMRAPVPRDGEWNLGQGRWSAVRAAACVGWAAARRSSGERQRAMKKPWVRLGVRGRVRVRVKARVTVSGQGQYQRPGEGEVGQWSVVSVRVRVGVHTWMPSHDRADEMLCRSKSRT